MDKHINDIAEALEASKGDVDYFLEYLNAAGYVIVPKLPTEGLLNSMALRYDHGIFAPYSGYPQGRISSEESRQCYIDGVKRRMRQLHEEVVGRGFYSPEKEQSYIDMEKNT